MGSNGERILKATAAYAALTDDGSAEYNDQVRELARQVEEAVYAITNERLGRGLAGLR